MAFTGEASDLLQGLSVLQRGASVHLPLGTEDPPVDSPVVIASNFPSADLATGLPVAALPVEGIGAVSRNQTIHSELKEDQLILLFVSIIRLIKAVMFPHVSLEWWIRFA